MGRREGKPARAGRALLLSVLLQGCGSSFPQLVRHADPLTPGEHMQLGAAYEQQGLKEEARRQYGAAIDLDKGYAPALVALGNLAFDDGDLKKAERCYRRVLRRDPNHAGANNNMAMVLLARGKGLDEAERFARSALREDGPLRPYVLDTLASIYMKQGRYPEARRALDAAAASAPADNKDLQAQLVRTRGRLAMDQ